MSWYSSMISPLQEGRRSWIQIFRSYDFGFYFRQIREEEQEKAIDLGKKSEQKDLDKTSKVSEKLNRKSIDVSL